MEKTKEIDIIKENPSLSGISGHGSSVSSESPDKQRITRKNKRKNTSEISIKVRESIQVPDNPSKKAKEDSTSDEKKDTSTILK